jgi:hypothetical protein
MNAGPDHFSSPPIVLTGHATIGRIGGNKPKR